MSRLEIKQHWFGEEEYVSISVAIGIAKLPSSVIKRMVDEVKHESTLCKMLRHKNIPFDVMPVAVDNFADVTHIHEAEYKDDIKIDGALRGPDVTTSMSDGPIVTSSNNDDGISWSTEWDVELSAGDIFRATDFSIEMLNGDFSVEQPMSAHVGMKAPKEMKARKPSFKPQQLSESEIEIQNERMAKLIDSIK